MGQDKEAYKDAASTTTEEKGNNARRWEGHEKGGVN